MRKLYNLTSILVFFLVGILLPACSGDAKFIFRELAYADNHCAYFDELYTVDALLKSDDRHYLVAYCSASGFSDEMTVDEEIQSLEAFFITYLSSVEKRYNFVRSDEGELFITVCSVTEAVGDEERFKEYLRELAANSEANKEFSYPVRVAHSQFMCR